MSLRQVFLELFLLATFLGCHGDVQERFMFCPDCKCPPPPPCWNAEQLGYKEIGKLGFFKLHPMRYRWHEAKATCEREGTRLMIVNNKEKANLITKLTDNRYLHVHVGFQKIITHRTILMNTVLDEPVEKMSYKVWAENPKDNNIRGCGAVEVGKGLKLLPCNIRLAFICERMKP